MRKSRFSEEQIIGKRQLNPVFPGGEIGAILLAEEGFARWGRSAQAA